MTKILLLYATSHGHTQVVAQAIADRVRTRGARVQMVNVHLARPPSPDAFDVVILGSRVHFNKLDRRLRAYVNHNHLALMSKPTYVFSVGLSPADAVVNQWCKDNRLRPRAVIALEGALPYRRYNPITRLMMKLTSRRTGHPTDTSRDYVFTNWEDVSAFADRITWGAPAGPVVPDRPDRDHA